MGIWKRSIDMNISIRFHESLDLRNVRASILGKGPKIRRKQLEFRERSTASELPSIRTAKTRISLKDVSSAQTFLFVDTDRPQLVIDKAETRNKRSRINPRIAAHERFDVGCEKISAYLQSEQLKDSKI